MPTHDGNLLFDGLLLLCALLAYVALRAPFGRLALHRDTGFYVPNVSVQTRKFAPFAGWNAFFSGGSRALPQLVHTAVYLRFGSQGYARAFRHVYSQLGFASACLAAAVGARLPGAPSEMFWIVLPLALALFAEAQYGAYFESAEAFETPVQLAGVWLVLLGLGEASDALLWLGVALLWLDAVAIKLTGAALAGSVSLALAWLQPAHAWPLVALGVLAALAYLGWLAASRVGLRRILRFMTRHELHVRRNYRSGLLLLVVKLGFAARLALRNPVLPLCALAGAVLLWPELRVARAVPPEWWVLLAYVAGALAGWMRQGHRVWYYQLPLLPFVALLAAAAIEPLSRRIGVNPALLALAVAAVSVAFNLYPMLRRDVDAYTNWLFGVYDRRGRAAGTEMASGNVALAHAAAPLRARVAGKSMLVLGPLNQASLLCDAAYDTPLTTLCELSEGVAGEPGPWLDSALRERPPDYVLDTDGSFARYADWLRVVACEYAPVERRGSLQLYARAG